MSLENPYQSMNNPEIEEKKSEENQEKEIFDFKKYLKERFELKDEDAGKDLENAELLKSKDLPEHYKKQYESLDDQRLEDVKILIVPDNIWGKSQPSESAAEQQLISFKESYFKNINKPDEIAWMAHELSHCKRFLDSNSPESYQKDMQTFAFDDIKSEYSYPNNKVEEYAFSRQFEYLKNQGKTKEEIVQMLKQNYDENDFLFFGKLLDKVYEKEDQENLYQIESIENLHLPADERVELLLVKAGVKPATKVELTSDIWKPWEGEVPKQINKEDLEKTRQGMEKSGLAVKFGEQKITDSPYSYEAEPNNWIAAKREELPIYAGKTPKDLEKLIEAYASGSDEALGRVFGYPETAIEAYIGKREAIHVKDLPEDIKKQEWFAFARFAILSKDNWQKELETPKLWAETVQKLSPKLYNEFIEFIRTAK